MILDKFFDDGDERHADLFARNVLRVASVEASNRHFWRKMNNQLRRLAPTSDLVAHYRKRLGIRHRYGE